MNLPTISIPKIGENTDLSRSISLLAPGGAIAVCILILFFIVWPKFTQILQLKTENQQLIERAEKLDVKAGKLAVLDKNELDTQLGIAEQILPSDKGVFSLVTQVERTAAVSGALLNRVELAPGSINKSQSAKAPSSQGAATAETEVTPKMQLRISLSGDYKSVLQFLNTIFSISRVVTINDLSLSSSGISGQSAQVRVSLTIDAYWLPLPNELSSIESPITELTPQELARLEQVRSTGFVVIPSIPSVSIGRPDLFAPF